MMMWEMLVEEGAPPTGAGTASCTSCGSIYAMTGHGYEHLTPSKASVNQCIVDHGN
jgi:hypothetical protein